MENSFSRRVVGQIKEVRTAVSIRKSFSPAFFALFFVFVTSTSAQVDTPQLVPSQPDSGVFSPSEGASQFNVQVTCGTVGATIRYTTDGNDPTTSSTSIANGGTIAITHNLTLRAKAWVGATASVTAWGNYHLGHAVAAGDFHTMTADFNGKLKTWGGNAQGRLGIGSPISPQASPVEAMNAGVIDMDGGAEDASGFAHSIILKDDGTVWCAGSNVNGRLGNNSGTDSDTWVQVQKWNGSAFVPMVNIRAVAAGVASGYALDYNGMVYSWGKNEALAPRLGQGGLGNSNVLYGVPVCYYTGAVLDGMVAIAAGNDHAMALRNDGTVWAWGSNALGQIGDNGGASDHRNQAVPVHAGDTNTFNVDAALFGVTAIAAGASHSIAVTSDGKVIGWGESAKGRLGNGYISAASNPKRRPVFVKASASVAQFTNARKVAAGGANTLLITDSGELWACGANGQHQIGDGSTTDAEYPVRVKTSAGVPLNSNIIDAAMGTQHGIALAWSGKIYTWGFDTSGQLGDGSADATDTAYATNSVGHPQLVAPWAHWRLDETTGTTAIDASDLGNVGHTDLSGSWAKGYPWTPPNPQTGGLSITDVLYTGEFGLFASNSGNRLLPTSNLPFSLAFWFRAETLEKNSIHALVSNETYLVSGVRVAIDYGGVEPAVQFWTTQSGGTLFARASTAIRAKRWYHLAITYNGSTAKVYLDGALAGTGTGTVIGNANDIRFGSGIGGVKTLGGSLDDVWVYQKELTRTEILALRDSLTDGDHVPDALERGLFGDLATVSDITDMDGDGVNELNEINNGTNFLDYYNGVPPDPFTVSEDDRCLIKLGGASSLIKYRIVTQPQHAEACWDRDPQWTDETSAGKPGLWLPNGKLHGVNQMWIYHPAKDYHGTDSFTFRAGEVDGSGGVDLTANINVTPTDDEPSAEKQSPIVVLNNGIGVPILLKVHNPDGYTLTDWVADVDWGGGSVTGTPPNLTYQRTAGEKGPALIIYSLNYTKGGLTWSLSGKQYVDVVEPIWLSASPSASGDGSSAGAPLNASTAAAYTDILMTRNFYCAFHYAPGTYRTLGYLFQARYTANAGCKHYGATPGNPDQTVIKLVGSLYARGNGTIFGSDYNRRVDGFEVHDVKLDCNPLENPNFTLGEHALKIDLGSVRTVSNVVLRWFGDSTSSFIRGFAKSFSVETSTNGTTWSTAYSTTNGAGGTEAIGLSNVPARYVRLNMLKQGALCSEFSLTEVEIYEQGNPLNIALAANNANVSISMETNDLLAANADPAKGAGKAIDGLDCEGSRWASRKRIGALAALFVYGSNYWIDGVKIVGFGTGEFGVENFPLFFGPVINLAETYENVIVENCTITEPAKGNMDGNTCFVMAVGGNNDLSNGVIRKCSFIDVDGDFLYSHALGANQAESCWCNGVQVGVDWEFVFELGQKRLNRNHFFEHTDFAYALRPHFNGVADTFTLEDSEMLMSPGGCFFTLSNPDFAHREANQEDLVDTYLNNLKMRGNVVRYSHNGTESTPNAGFLAGYVDTFDSPQHDAEGWYNLAGVRNLDCATNIVSLGGGFDFMTYPISTPSAVYALYDNCDGFGHLLPVLNEFAGTPHSTIQQPILPAP